MQLDSTASGIVTNQVADVRKKVVFGSVDYELLAAALGAAQKVQPTYNCGGGAAYSLFETWASNFS
jgi:hypothetical protein